MKLPPPPARLPSSSSSIPTRNENTNPQVAQSSPNREEVTEEVKGQEKTLEELEFDRYGFYQPPKIRRRVALHLNGADPKQCLDIIDDLYAFYMDMEVSLLSLAGLDPS